MKRFLFFLIFSVIITSVYSQTKDYEKLVSKADSCEKTGDYFMAQQFYDAAAELKLSKEQKQEVAAYQNAIRNKIKQQYLDLQAERAKTDSLYQQTQTATFEKAAIQNNSQDYFGTWHYEEIYELDFSNSNLQYLPAEVLLCKNLKSINLIGNSDLQYDSVYAVLRTLPLITDLKISVDSIEQIPLRYLRWTTGIKIKSTGLNDFPTEFLNLPNLKYLDLSGTAEQPNNFDSLPKQLFTKSKLKTLVLENCNLKALPNEISELSKLETLKLSGNELSELPETVGKLENLEILGIENNKFDTIPASVFELEQLKILSCYNNQITKLPKEIGKLKQIEALYVWDNQISEIPDEICELTKLKDLRINSNTIAEVNPRILCLNNLQHLDLSNNDIKQLPTSIGDLYQVEEMYVNNNKLENLPPEIAKMSSLKELNASNNNITTLPKEIGKLEKLEKIDLSHNQLTVLPDEITELDNLQEINIESNQLKTLPAEMEQMPELKYVEFENNEFSEEEKARIEKEFDLSTSEEQIEKNKNVNNVSVPENMVLISAKNKTFTMGSPSNEPEREDDETQHQVTFSYDFLMGKYEVTQAEYENLMGNDYAKDYGVGDNYPVYYVSWWDAIKYCNALSKKEGFPVAYNESTGDLLDANGNKTTDITKVKGYRLPTEAEWEYACRGEDTRQGVYPPFYTGNNLTTSQANYDGNIPYNGNAKGTYREKTIEVGSFSPNSYGLYDMHGNVWEWCHDWFDDYIGNVTNPIGPSTGSYRVLRGGSWIYYAKFCRSANRRSNIPTNRDSNDGFRIARSQ